MGLRDTTTCEVLSTDDGTRLTLFLLIRCVIVIMTEAVLGLLVVYVSILSS